MIKGWDGGLAINGGCWDLVTATVEDDEDDCDDVTAAGGELLLLSTTGSGTETIQRMVEISSDFRNVVGFSRENVLVVVMLLDDSLLSVGGVDDEGGDDVGDGQGSHRAFRFLDG